ncbi:MAG: hypothetical protein A2Y62_15565 [Candidatus Fischerbacteria bacterium RBG_13_37_8]|uniref:DUF4931 domain-containing protein n=1 Tax=Candidatus Fischerbacteria bacterium RBG_13_37_8 TaxID=1817863 RepID=A0A1F5VL07_9BACT|nr:MAG: hypothetical protein A2Y62_15565 [Candidatus Fischerbacteria bacterium RBG_13_37_8]
MEWRKCTLTNQWYLVGAKDIEMNNVKFDNCPFCPGGEYSNAYKIDEINNGNDHVVCIPNPQKSLIVEEKIKRVGIGFFDMMNNIGADEIIMETQHEHKPFSQFSEEHLALVFKMFARRIDDLKNDDRFRHVIAYRNQSEYTGSPFQHPFSRIMAFPMVPKIIDNELFEARKHFVRKDRCLFCDIIAEEIRTRVRIVVENKEFVAFCPYASRFPYEVWVAPVHHSSSFEKDMQGNILSKLAEIMSMLLPKVEKVASSYFLALHTSPNEKSAAFKNHQWETLQDDYHWHIEITPKYLFADYIERRSGYIANSVLPEKAAEEMRS